MEGMVTKFEKQYLRNYASQDYTGLGEIVDLGCWMGATTTELAIGLQSNPNPVVHSHKIHAFDLFIWYPWMDSCVKGTPLEGKYQPGENFVQDFLENIAPWQQNVEVHAGDLTQKHWSAGPIEFLFIDAMKSWPLANSIIYKFFPALMPGKSIIVQQDYTYFLTYWIQLVMYRLRDYFEPVYDVPYSPSLAFRYTREAPKELFEVTYSKDSFSLEEIDEAFRYAESLVPVEKRPIIAACKLTALMEKYGILPLESLSQAMSDLYVAQGQTLYLASQVDNYKSQVQSKNELIEQLSQKLQHKQGKISNKQKRIDNLEAKVKELESSKFFKLRNVWHKMKKQMKFS